MQKTVLGLGSVFYDITPELAMELAERLPRKTKGQRNMIRDIEAAAGRPGEIFIQEEDVKGEAFMNLCQMIREDGAIGIRTVAWHMPAATVQKFIERNGIKKRVA